MGERISQAVESGPAAAREERLAAVLAGLTADLRSGRAADLERAAHEHPDLAGELRELWAAAMIAEELAAHASGVQGPDVTLSADGRCPQAAAGRALPATGTPATPVSP